jgi:hypothetical protein
MLGERVEVSEGATRFARHPPSPLLKKGELLIALAAAATAAFGAQAFGFFDDLFAGHAIETAVQAGEPFPARGGIGTQSASPAFSTITTPSISGRVAVGAGDGGLAFQCDRR